MTPVSVPRLTGALRFGALPARKPVIRIEKPEVLSRWVKPASPSSRDFLLFKFLVALSYLFSLLSLAFVLRACFLGNPLK